MVCGINDNHATSYNISSVNIANIASKNFINFEKSESRSVKNKTEKLLGQLHSSLPDHIVYNSYQGSQVEVSSWRHGGLSISKWMTEVFSFSFFNPEHITESCKALKNTAIAVSTTAYQYLANNKEESTRRISNWFTNIYLTFQRLLVNVARFCSALQELVKVFFDAWYECMFENSDEKVNLAVDVLESYLLSFEEEKQLLKEKFDDYKKSIEG